MTAYLVAVVAPTARLPQPNLWRLFRTSGTSKTVVRSYATVEEATKAAKRLPSPPLDGRRGRGTSMHVIFNRVPSRAFFRYYPPWRMSAHGSVRGYVLIVFWRFEVRIGPGRPYRYPLFVVQP